MALPPPAPPAPPAMRATPAKADGALRTIGELAAETGIPPHILRYWEKNVPGLRPLRRSGGRRYYRQEDGALIRRLHHLVSVEGYTLDGAARAVGAKDAAPPPPAAASQTGVMTVAALRVLRDRLAAALDG